MKCPKCKTKMGIRTGKFGDFYFCPNSSSRDVHKTITVPVKSKPAIKVMKFNPAYGGFDLDAEIRRDVHCLGLPDDHLTRLAEFCIGDPSDVADNEEHWSNYRPY